jgi:hypothetical protein
MQSMYIRIKREKLVSRLCVSKHSRACTGFAPLQAILSPHVQTVFMHVEPTDTVTMLKDKLQELLQQVSNA